MHVYGSNELVEDVLKKDLCIGCGACVDLCPYFKTHKGKTTMIFPCTLTQGRCHAFCPKTEVDLDAISVNLRGISYDGSPLGVYQKILISRKGPRMGPGRFQAGGTVSSLMTFALKDGIIDAAVLTDRKGLYPTAGLAESTDEVAGFSGSKYTAASTLSAMNRGTKKGYRKMGVVGTPCQMTALAQMRSNSLEREDFVDPVTLSIGLFCTWALDPQKLIGYLKNRIDISEIKGMDIPPPPAEVLILDLGDKMVEFPLAEIRPLVPNTCLLCPDMTSEWADVSVGVLEGKSDVNTLIVRSAKGQALVEDAVRGGWLEVEEMPAQNLDHLTTAAANKKKRALIRVREDGLLNVAENGKRSMLRINPDVVERIIA
jgi:coenzyme F420 hydrogenase subunit beta